MAVTHGHGNPAWTREETILALALYFEQDEALPSERHPAVRELSKLLRSLTYHALAARKESFRNPAGVAFKLQNLQSVRTGKGLKNVSQMDRTVWTEFHENPEEVKRISRLVRSGIGSVATASPFAEDDGIEFNEGRLITLLHTTRERDYRIRQRLLHSRRRNGPLTCDLCRCQSSSSAPAFQDAIFEGHHLKPLSMELVERTKLDDLALLCAIVTV